MDKGASFEPENGPNSRFPVIPASGERDAEDGFFAPVPARPASATRTVAAAPSPYDHDARGYRWLRGKLDYDALSQTWSIIYSLNPGRDDRYGGSFTLGSHPDFRRFASGDVVLIEGQVDDATRNPSNGKPVYRPSKLFGPLVPAAGR